MESQCWFYCYPEKLLTDTFELSAHDFGAYTRALMWYYTNGPLPKDDERLRNIMRVDPQNWNRCKGMVMPYFYENGDGRWHQKRADLEIKRRDDLISKRQNQTAAARAARHSTETVTTPVTSNAELVIHDREYQRVLEQIRQIENTYSGHQTWASRDKEDHRKLVIRRNELRKLLKIQT